MCEIGQGLSRKVAMHMRIHQMFHHATQKPRIPRRFVRFYLVEREELDGDDAASMCRA